MQVSIWIMDMLENHGIVVIVDERVW